MLYRTRGIRVGLSRRSPSRQREIGHDEALALPATCREIREESIGVFYAVNRFKLNTNLVYDKTDGSVLAETEIPGCGAVLEKWTEMLGTANLGHLRRVNLDLGFSSFEWSSNVKRATGDFLRLTHAALANSSIVITVDYTTNSLDDLRRLAVCLPLNKQRCQDEFECIESRQRLALNTFTYSTKHRIAARKAQRQFEDSITVLTTLKDIVMAL